MMKIGARAIEQLTDRTAPNAFQLTVEALKDESPLVRVTAAHKLAERKDDRALEHLVTLAMEDNHIDVLHAAIEGLRSLNRSKCVERLMREVDSEDSAVRQVGARILWKICDERTDPAIMARIAIELGEWHVVAEIGDDAIGPLRAALEHGTPRLQREAAEAFVSVGTTIARDTLIEVMNDRALELNARNVAAWALWQFRWTQLPPVDYVRAALRLEQWAALKDMGTSAVGPLVEALDDMDGPIRLKAVDLLAHIANDEAITSLCRALCNPTTDATVRECIAKSLPVQDDLISTDALASALADESWPVRAAAGRSLKARSWLAIETEQKARFALVCGDWEELGRLGPDAVDVLVEALRFPAVNRRAAETLGKLGEIGVCALLAAQVDPDAHPVIRELIAITLAELGDQRALEPLRHMLRDPDAVIRNASVLTLERLGWTPATEGEQAVAAIAHDNWAELGRLGAAAVEPLCCLLQSGCATPEAVAAFEKILSKWAGRIPLDWLRSLLNIEDMPVTALAGSAEEGKIDCSKLRQHARLELIRRGIVL